MSRPHYARFHKDTRYYEIMLQQNLFLEWEVWRVFGRRGTGQSRLFVEPVNDYQQAKHRFDRLCHYRTTRRHYIQVN